MAHKIAENHVTDYSQLLKKLPNNCEFETTLPVCFIFKQSYSAVILCAA